MRSLARIGLDRLLMFCPHFDVLRVEWQHDGPWVLVDLGQPSTHNGAIPNANSEPDAFAIHPYAIWKATGTVYGITDGAVNDEPLLTL